MTIDIKAICARAAAATEGPWETLRSEPCCVASPEHWDLYNTHKNNVFCLATMRSDSSNDATFIAHARADVPALCDEVERLRAALSRCLGLIAANRLMLGEYSGPREVATVERDAKKALEWSDEK